MVTASSAEWLLNVRLEELQGVNCLVVGRKLKQRNVGLDLAFPVLNIVVSFLALATSVRSKELSKDRGPVCILFNLEIRNQSLSK